MTPPKKTAGSTAVSVKIPRAAWKTAQRLAKREQRTITVIVERAIESYRATTEGSAK